MQSTLVPDPLSFALEDLARRGALVDGAAKLCLLPGPVAHELSLPEEVVLQEAPVAGSEAEGRPAAAPRVPCGLGSPLLQKLVGDARGQVGCAHVRLLQNPPKPGHAAALGERFVVRNGLSELLDAFPGESTYVRCSAAYVAEADDRHEGVVHVTVHAADGGAPDEHLQGLLAPELAPAGMVVPLPAGATAPGAEAALPYIDQRAGGAVRAVMQQVEEGLARRHARDHARISEYFGAMITEALRPRRRVDPQAIAAKVAHLCAERDSKLADLQARFRLRVSVQPVALLCAVVPVVRVRLLVRRRKESRELVLRLPAGAHSLDRLVCDGCGGLTGRPALCDDRLHALCEVCVPSAQGRPRCPACKRKA